MKVRYSIILVSLPIILFIFFQASYSQPIKSAEKKGNRSDVNISPVIESIVNESYSVPAEVAIDVLLEIVKSPKIPSVKKEAILLDAYRRLDEVQQPVQKTLALYGMSTDTRQSFLSQSFALKLDSSSLKNKILIELLKVDKPKVRELVFQNQPELSFQSINCKDALDYKIEDFYVTLTVIARETFTSDEKEHNIRLYALIPYIQNIKSASQIAPIGKMLTSLDLTPAESNELILSYSSAVKKFSSTDRSFFFNLQNSLNSFDGLLELANNKNLYKETLADAFRTYITRQFRGERCADNAKSYEIYTPSTIKWLNQNSFKITPITGEDIVFEKLSDSAAFNDFWKTENSRKLLDKLKNLRFDMSVSISEDESEMPPLRSKDDKKKPEWKEMFTESLTEAENWNGENEKDQSDYFHQKCIIYRGLIEIADEESDKNRVLESYEKFLSSSSFQKENRIEWIFHSLELIKLARKNEFVFRLLSNSKNPVFRIYADLISLKKNNTISS